MQISERQIILGGAALLVVTLMTIHFVFAGPSAFRRLGYIDARREAVKEGKFLYAVFGNNGCSSCRRLDSTTHANPAVRAWLRDNAVAVKLDTNTRENNFLAASFGINVIPTIVVVSPMGEEVARYNMISTSEFLYEMDEIKRAYGGTM